MRIWCKWKQHKAVSNEVWNLVLIRVRGLFREIRIWAEPLWAKKMVLGAAVWQSERKQESVGLKTGR
jgi:hypothetical protein